MYACNSTQFYVTACRYRTRRNVRYYNIMEISQNNDDDGKTFPKEIIKMYYTHTYTHTYIHNIYIYV